MNIEKKYTHTYIVWLAGNIRMSSFYLSIEYANLVTLLLDWWLFFTRSSHLCATLYHSIIMGDTFEAVGLQLFSHIESIAFHSKSHLIIASILDTYTITNKWKDSITTASQNVLFRRKICFNHTINICWKFYCVVSMR